MSYILRESVGCCLQDADRKIYKSEDCKKRLKELFLAWLEDSEYLDKNIEEIKKEINEEGYIEEEHYYFDGSEAWIDFEDVYETRTFFNIVD